jgi:hypothetical protein
MVRFIPLALLVAACWAAAPAQADVVPAAGQALIAQAPTTTVAAVSEATAVTTSVAPSVKRVGADATTKAGPAASAADPTIRNAAELSQPTTDAAGYTTASFASPQADGAKGPQASSLRPGASARFRSSGRLPAGSSAAHRGAGAALPHFDGRAPRAAVPRAAGVASKDAPAAPEPGAYAGGAAGASAGAGSFFFGGMALLAAALCLAGPRLRRRLLIRPAASVPVVFVSLLERPG